MAVILAFLSALAISAVSLIGVLVFFKKEELHGVKVHALLALAAGAMLGNALLHLLPHGLTLEQAAMESANPPAIVQLFDGHDHAAEVEIHGEHQAVHDHEGHAHSDEHNHQGHAHVDEHNHQGDAHADEDDHDEYHAVQAAEDDHASHGHTGLFTCLLFMFGIGLFGAFDLWLHRNRPQKDRTVSSEGYMVIVGDLVENLLDGIVIGTAYLLSIPAGMAATFTIFLHEIPLEMGDFAVLRHSGFSQRKAVIFNLTSGLMSVVGVAIAVILGYTLSGFALYATSLAAGGFTYIALSILVPKLRDQCCTKSTLLYMLMIALGIALMTSLLFFE